MFIVDGGICVRAAFGSDPYDGRSG